METIKEAVRALQSEQPVILSAWLEDVQARLWHLDHALFTRRGVLIGCGRETLTALNGFLQAAANSENPLVASSPSETMACAQSWAACALAWSDLRVLLTQLAAHTRTILSQKAIEPEAQQLCEGFWQSIVTMLADHRVTELERQLASLSEEAIASQHLAGRFLANASHEVRTPLTAVLGFSELLLEEAYGPLTPEQRTNIGHIENSAQNLLEIINNLLDLLHIRAGKLTLNYRPIQAAQLLHDLYNILVPLATRKNVVFTLDVPDTLGVIEADENIVRHILYHLVSSSLRSTPAGGTVSVSAERSDQRLTALIRDTALHLPPEAIANMQPFRLLENSPARGYEGWEVGLPLVRRYIDLHGGELEMDSRPEQGTLFRVSFPVTRAHASASGKSSNA